jgi:hypothetical protein
MQQLVMYRKYRTVMHDVIFIMILVKQQFFCYGTYVHVSRGSLVSIVTTDLTT